MYIFLNMHLIWYPLIMNKIKLHIQSEVSKYNFSCQRYIKRYKSRQRATNKCCNKEHTRY